MKTLTLTRQLIAIIILLLFITSLATSLPALLLLYGELERQIELRLSVGEEHTQTIWTLTEFQVRQSVTLASQRPTLRQFVLDGTQTDIDSYLETFLSSTSLDFLYVQTRNAEILGGISPDIPIDIDQISVRNSLPVFAVQSPLTEDTVVIGGIWLDNEFLQLLSQQTNLIYQVPPISVEGDQYRTQAMNLSENFELEILLDISDIRFIQMSAFISVLGIALFTAGFGSLVGGLYLRQRIRPLWRLRAFAKNLGEGDLNTPIVVDTYSPEIRTLADTLEHSRQHISRVMQELQQQRDWSNALMQSIVEGIISVNQNGIIVFHSESTRQIMGWEKDQIGEKLNIAFLIPDSDHPFSHDLPPEGGRKLIVVLSNHQPITLLITRARTLPDGEITLVIRDVTEESRQTKAHAYYLANMSHEFRTPLSGMKASLELLIENDRSLARAERQQLLNSLLMSVSNLQRLIDNLLEGSKLQAQQFSLHSKAVRFEQILVDSLHTMQPLLSRRQQAITLSTPLSPSIIHADRTRLVQVLVNLLSNASKYSTESSEIALIVQHHNLNLWVGVADRGQGIPETQRELIFQQFVRLEQNAISDHSTGLGLSVVRGIIEAHGGKVGVDPRESGGSVFWFSIPLMEAGTTV